MEIRFMGFLTRNDCMPLTIYGVASVRSLTMFWQQDYWTLAIITAKSFKPVGGILTQSAPHRHVLTSRILGNERLNVIYLHCVHYVVVCVIPVLCVSAKLSMAEQTAAQRKWSRTHSFVISGSVNVCGGLRVQAG